MDKVRAKIGQRTVRLDFGAAGGNAVDYPVDVATGDAADRPIAPCRQEFALRGALRRTSPVPCCAARVPGSPLAHSRTCRPQARLRGAAAASPRLDQSLGERAQVRHFASLRARHPFRSGTIRPAAPVLADFSPEMRPAAARGRAKPACAARRLP